VSKPTAVIVGVGAERGLGAALCRRFAAEGYHVLVAGRSADKIKQVVQTIAAAGGSAEPVVADATIEGDISRLFDRAMAPGDGVSPADLVVYNAGNNQKIEFRELSADLFEDFWRVGCFGGFLVGREAARRLAPLGGSVPLGHPFGATGARILSQAVKELAALPKSSRAIVSICADGGLGTVALLEHA